MNVAEYAETAQSIGQIARQLRVELSCIAHCYVRNRQLGL
jgi:hypothetical protein